jgi:hypothetical protein
MMNKSREFLITGSKAYDESCQENEANFGIMEEVNRKYFLKLHNV